MKILEQENGAVLNPGDGSLPWHEFPSGLTEPPVAAVNVEPTAEAVQAGELGESAPAKQREDIKGAINSPVFFIGNIASAKIPMTHDEYQTLLTSIDKDGQSVEIKVRKTDDGRFEIIDGYHRYRACAELGKNVKFTEVAGSDEAMRELSDRLNDKRRHLTQARLAKWVVDRTVAKPEGRPGENSATTAEFEKALKLKAKELGVGVGDIKPRAEMIKLKGVSKRSVEMAAQIKEMSLEAYAKIDAKGLSLEKALKLAKAEKQKADQSTGKTSDLGGSKPEPSEEKKLEKALEKMRLAIREIFLHCFPNGKDRRECATKAMDLCSVLGVESSKLDFLNETPSAT